MIEISVQGTRKVMGELERELDRFITTMAEDIRQTAVKNTPVDSGLARRSWRLESSYKEKRIVNRASHIVPLENGHSKQAPNGIMGPTIREISKRRYKI